MQIGKPDARTGGDLAKILGQNVDANPAGKASGNPREESAGALRPTARTESELIEISSEAQARAEREEALQVLREAYRGLEGIRREVVASVRQKIESGYYDSEHVLNQVAERLLPYVKS